MAKVRVRKIKRPVGRSGARARGAKIADERIIEFEDAEESPTTGATDTGDGPGRPAEGSAPGGTVETDEAGAPTLAEGVEGIEIGLDDQTAPDDDTPPERLDSAGRRVGRRGWNLRGVGRPRGGTGRPRPPSSEPAPKKPPPPKIDANMGGFALMVIESMTVNNLGPEAAFTPQEKGLIKPPLDRILARMTPQGAAMFATIADPLMLGVGLLMWGTRIFNLAQQGRQGAPQRQPTPIRPTVAPGATQAAPGAPSEGPALNIDPNLDAAFGPGRI